MTVPKLEDDDQWLSTLNKAKISSVFQERDNYKTNKTCKK